MKYLKKFMNKEIMKDVKITMKVKHFAVYSFATMALMFSSYEVGRHMGIGEMTRNVKDMLKEIRVNEKDSVNSEIPVVYHMHDNRPTPPPPPQPPTPQPQPSMRK